MRVEKLGDGEPEYAVIGLIHGDEPCGKHAIERFLKTDFDILKPVKFIIANEKAAEKEKRFIGADLNRSFPGGKNAKLHEERLAAEILEEVQGLKVLDLHSTQSTREIFAAQSKLDQERLELVKSTGVKKVSCRPGDKIGCLDEHTFSVAVECGLQQSKQAKENSYSIIVNFLADEGVIEEKFKKSEPEVFEIFETVEKPSYEFLADNFKPVKKGEIYAKNGEDVLTASKEFYPVLMSTNGYKDILGCKAKKIKN